MSSEELRLRELDRCLMAIPVERDGMLVSDLDGFVAGLHCCPELIPPSEWLPLVWGDDDESAPFDSQEQLESTMANVLAHYNAVGMALRRGRYEPLFDVDERDDEVIWELWITGFVTAMELRPDAWIELIGSDGDTALAISGLTMLAGVDEGEIELSEAELAELNEDAPDLIVEWVRLLHEHRTGAERAAPVRVGAKVGRNDPCPCGSGKKYKKCCGAH
jgi:uncharacterized protein